MPVRVAPLSMVEGGSGDGRAVEWYRTAVQPFRDHCSCVHVSICLSLFPIVLHTKYLLFSK